MSLTLNFNGIVAPFQPPYQNVTIPYGAIPQSTQQLANPQAFTPPSSSPQTQILNIDGQQIIWQPQGNQTIPSYLVGKTIAQLLSDTSIKINLTRTITFSITSTTQAFQYATFNSAPSLNVYLWSKSGTSYTAAPEDLPGQFNLTSLGTSGFAGNVPYCINTTCPSSTVVLNNNAPAFIVDAVTLNSWNRCDPGAPNSCNGYDAQQLTFTYSTNVQLTIVCDSTDIGSGFCLNYCISSQDSTVACEPTFRQTCLVNTDVDGNEIILNSVPCQTFYKAFMSGVGPGSNGTVDNLFKSICSKATPTLEIYNKSPEETQKICACHLSDSFYANLQSSLTKEFPGSQLIAEVAQCLFPNCATSPYKFISFKQCPLPACVNIASITNNGTVGGSNIINQDNNCVNLSKKGGANDPSGSSGNGGGNTTTPKSWIDQHWMWIVIGVAVVIILILVIVIIAASGTKKKPQNMNYLDMV